MQDDQDRVMPPAATGKLGLPVGGAGRGLSDDAGYRFRLRHMDRVAGRDLGCLNLNVWTPRLPPGGSADPGRPVLVWFHGGGFTSGSGGWDWYDGRNLAAAGDIVVVPANYRIGPLGYLYLPELGTENIGTQDQAAVLAWVRRNITAFGGDPSNVTARPAGSGSGVSADVHSPLNR